MATSIVIDMSEVRTFAAKMPQAKPLIQAEMVTTMQRSTIAVQSKARELITSQGAVDTGRLRGSITEQVLPISGGVQGIVGSNMPYAAVIEYGRRPGAAMPTAGSLLGWMSRHGIPASAEYVIRRAIGRRGQPARPYLAPALQQTTARILADFRELPARVMARLGL